MTTFVKSIAPGLQINSCTSAPTFPHFVWLFVQSLPCKSFYIHWWYAHFACFQLRLRYKFRLALWRTSLNKDSAATQRRTGELDRKSLYSGRCSFLLNTLTLSQIYAVFKLKLLFFLEKRYLSFFASKINSLFNQFVLGRQRKYIFTNSSSDRIIQRLLQT